MNSSALSRLSEQPRKVFVLAYLDQALPDRFEQGVVAALRHELEVLGPRVEAVELNGLELDRHAHERARAAFAPDAVLIVAFRGKAESELTQRGVIEMTLLDSHDAELWRCAQGFAVTSPAFAGALFDSGRRAGKAAVQRLVADRVFPGTI
jgi:hypothetical protein